MCWVATDIRPEAVVEMLLVLLPLVMYLLPDGYGNQNNFGLCHDSLNSLNSVKAIWRKRFLSLFHKLTLIGKEKGSGSHLVRVSICSYSEYMNIHTFQCFLVFPWQSKISPHLKQEKIIIPTCLKDIRYLKICQMFVWQISCAEKLCVPWFSVLVPPAAAVILKLTEADNMTVNCPYLSRFLGFILKNNLEQIVRLATLSICFIF